MITEIIQSFTCMYTSLCEFTMSQYLLQKSREGWFAECIKQRSDRVEIDSWDLWVGFEVGVIAEKTNKYMIVYTASNVSSDY